MNKIKCPGVIIIELTSSAKNNDRNGDVEVVLADEVVGPLVDLVAVAVSFAVGGVGIAIFEDGRSIFKLGTH